MGRYRIKKTVRAMNKENKILIIPDVQYNCGWIEEISTLSNDNIKIASRYYEEILLNTDFEGYSAFVFLNFSAN